MANKQETGSRPTQTGNGDTDQRSTNMRDSKMMAHLLDALEKGTDIGHYGRLTFVMVARHFMDDRAMVKLLAKQPGSNDEEAQGLVAQVKGHDYNPPKPDRIKEWQSQQDFPICPDPEEPGSCNVYAELRFPEHIYENINQFWEHQNQ